MNKHFHYCEPNLIKSWSFFVVIVVSSSSCCHCHPCHQSMMSAKAGAGSHQYLGKWTSPDSDHCLLSSSSLSLQSVPSLIILIVMIIIIIIMVIRITRSIIMAVIMLIFIHQSLTILETHTAKRRTAMATICRMWRSNTCNCRSFVNCFCIVVNDDMNML